MLETKPRVARAPGLRLRATRLAAATVGALVAVCALMLTDYAYPVLATLLDLSPMTAVATTRPEVGLLVDSQGKAAGSIARELSQRDMTASLALDDAPSPRALAEIRGHADDVIPRLDSGGVFHSLGTRGRLLRTASSLGVGDRFFYEPDGDFTLGQYVLAHYAGGSPVRGGVRVNPGDRVGPLHAGQIVQLEAVPAGARWTATLDSLRSRLARGGLTGVTVPQLVHAGGN